MQQIQGVASEQNAISFECFGFKKALQLSERERQWLAVLPVV